MLTLSAKIRKITGKKTKILRKNGVLPAVLYGPKLHPVRGQRGLVKAQRKQTSNGVKNLNLEINSKDFEKVFKEAGESSLVKIEVGAYSPRKGDGSSQAGLENRGPTKKDFQVLIHAVQRDPLSGKPIHVDFYLPLATAEIAVKVPIVLGGEAPAVKEFGGILVRDIYDIEVKGLVQNLPKEIKVDIFQLKKIGDHILVENLNLPQGVKVLKDPKEIIISIAPPAKIEEELAKPAEEKVEEVEVVEKEKKPSFAPAVAEASAGKEATEGEEEGKKEKK